MNDLSILKAQPDDLAEAASLRIKGATLFSEGKRGLLVAGMRIEIQEVRNVIAAYEA